MIELRRTYKYRLYHCGKRNKHLHRQINVAGRIWNHCLALQRRYCRRYGGHIPAARLMQHIAKLRMKTVRYADWRALGSQAVQDVVQRLDKAYQRFFAGQGGRPRFKKVKKYSSFTLKQAGWKRLGDNQVRIGEHTYKYVAHREIQGTIKTVTIKRDRRNRLWVCFSVIKNYTVQEEASTGQIGGFDFGLRTFLTDEQGRSYTASQPFRQALAAIQRLHRQLSRKQPHSHNRWRARCQLARAYDRVANCRRQEHYRLAHALCDEYDILVFEDLNLDGMKRLWGRKVSDLSFDQFLHILGHVARKRGKQVVCIDRFEPTTQTCSCCGHQQPVALHERTFACGACGVAMDRDHNAARNMVRVGASTLGLEMVSHPVTGAVSFEAERSPCL